MTNTNPVVIAAGGTGVYTIKDSGFDYTFGGNIALNNAATFQTTAGGAIFLTGTITGSPNIIIDGGGTTTKFVGINAVNSSTFTGNILIQNKGQLKFGNSAANAFADTTVVTLDSTAAIDCGLLSQTFAGLNDVVSGAGGSAIYNNGTTLTLAGNGTYGYSGSISGNGSLNKTGAGFQLLSGSNSYSGGTTVNSGTLQIGNGSTGTFSGAGATTVSAGAMLALNLVDGASVSSSIQLSGVSGSSANLNLMGGGTNTITGNVTGTFFSAINQNGTGTTILSGNNVFYGPVNINAGTVQLSGSYSAYAAVVNVNANNGLAFGLNSLSIGGLTGSGNFALVNGTNAVSLSVTNTYSDTVYSGALQGSLGTLIKSGTGMLTLTGSTAFSGGFQVSVGTLQIGNANALGATGTSSVTTLNGGTLDLNGFSIGETLNVSSSSALINSSTSAAALTVDANLNSDLTINTTGDITATRLIGLNALRTITKNGAGTLTTNGASHNNLAPWIINAGTLVLANSSGYGADRGVTINDGTLKLSGANSDLINARNPSSSMVESSISTARMRRSRPFRAALGRRSITVSLELPPTAQEIAGRLTVWPCPPA